jgi:hypothetical protein
LGLTALGAGFLVILLFALPIVYLAARILLTLFVCKTVKKDIAEQGLNMTKGFYFALIKPLTPLASLTMIFDWFPYVMFSVFVINMSVYFANKGIAGRSKAAKIYTGAHIVSDIIMLLLAVKYIFESAQGI